MSTWIFQGNPAQFDINNLLAEYEDIWWTLRQKHFQDVIEFGDEVFIWRSDGPNKGTGGILARAIVKGPPENRADSILDYWKSDAGSKQELRVPLQIQETKLTKEEGFLKRTDLKDHPILKDLLIHKMRTATNYLLSHEHAQALRTLWEQTNLASPSDEVYLEGTRLSKLHVSIERNASLIHAVKQRAKRLDPMLHCTVCNFSFYETYGEIGLDYIEAHHIVPISEIHEEYEATIDDIALVCSNCHRMLHRKRPWVHIDTLKQLLIQP